MPSEKKKRLCLEGLLYLDGRVACGHFDDRCIRSPQAFYLIFDSVVIDEVLSTLTIWYVLVSGTNLVATRFLVLLTSMLFSAVFIFFQVLPLESHFEVASPTSGTHPLPDPLRVTISLYFVPISVSKSSF